MIIDEAKVWAGMPLCNPLLWGREAILDFRFWILDCSILEWGLWI